MTYNELDATREENRQLRLGLSELETAVREAVVQIGSPWRNHADALRMLATYRNNIEDFKVEHERRCYKLNSEIRDLKGQVKLRDRKIALLIDYATCREIRAVADAL